MDRYDELQMIPEGRRRVFDTMFEAFAMASGRSHAYLTDMKYGCTRWTPLAVKRFGFPSEYIFDIGSIWNRYVHPDDRQVCTDMIEDVAAGKVDRLDMQYRILNAKGEYMMVVGRGVMMRDADGDPDYLAGTVTVQESRGFYDDITGLRNQYGFFEDLDEGLNTRKNMVISMIGISRFSELNEVYGYAFGNTLLQKVGRYLFEHVGNEGCVYRMDGTRFAVIREQATDEEMQKSYDDLRALFRDGFTLDGHYVILEMNAAYLKVNTFEIDEKTICTCLNSAYEESKRERRGDLVSFSKDLNDDKRRQIEMIQVIRTDMARDFTGFYLTYQPIVDTKTEKMIGAEALLRWSSDLYGVVPPDEFIPILEQDSLFPGLGRWILHTALSESVRVLEAHPDFTLNVNLAYTQIERPEFFEMIREALDATGFPASHLCLEITERCRLLDMGMLAEVCDKLRRMGIRIALDDFGTGYSAVSLIMGLPLDLLKIDRSFISDIVDNQQQQVLVGEIVKASEKLGFDVCVEGVENVEMRDCLRRFEPGSLQGYYYGRPLTIEEFLVWDQEQEG